MKRLFIPFTLLAVFSILMGSCILDPAKKPPGGGEQPLDYKSLKEKDDVLINLELSYNDRNITQYDRLLDDAFTFIFSDGDFASGKTDQQWNRAKELLATQHIFDRNYSGENDPIRSISLILSYTAGDLTWEETSPPQESEFEGEKWYQKTVNYDLTVETTGDVTLYALESQALFVVRFAPSENDTIWRTIEWYDLGQN